MIRTVSAIIIALLPMNVFAGDFAEFRPIGFSADGKVFAFEEFGQQDGSGFAYATRTYINTEDDSFLAGTPVRVVLEDESKSIYDARAMAREQAADIEASSGASEDAGIFAAFNPATEMSDGDGLVLNYRNVAFEPHGEDSNTVKLTEIDFPLGDCPDFGQPIKGFKLEMTTYGGQPVERLLHEDSRIPASRRCPVSYRIGGAMTHQNPDGTVTQAILILVRSIGFEGPDGRYLAVTARID